MFNPENKIIVGPEGNAEQIPLTQEEKDKLIELKKTEEIKKKNVLSLVKDQTIVVDEKGNAEIKGSGKNILKPR